MTINLGSVRQSFLRAHVGRHRTLSELSNRISASVAGDDDIQDTVTLLHTICGTAETLGFNELGQQARATEAAGEAALRDKHSRAAKAAFRQQLDKFLVLSEAVVAQR